ncbi:MAG: SUMO-targeted ubiquitin ligase complex subunit slx8 [Trizodia sp. TS-e1964]|nr:MAG: SUMO-targeted ubiquitin ligase complex subunit slx8 [Trizodia sp. TS-e1964]
MFRGGNTGSSLSSTTSQMGNFETSPDELPRLAYQNTHHSLSCGLTAELFYTFSSSPPPPSGVERQPHPPSLQESEQQEPEDTHSGLASSLSPSPGASGLWQTSPPSSANSAADRLPFINPFRSPDSLASSPSGSSSNDSSSLSSMLSSSISSSITHFSRQQPTASDAPLSSPPPLQDSSVLPDTGQPAPSRLSTMPSIVDLTSSQQAPAQAPSNKRTLRDSDSPLARSTKRARQVPTVTRTTRSSVPPPPLDLAGVETVDLLEVDDDTGLAAVLAKQREELLKAQQKDDPRNGPAKLSNLMCIICLDVPTDIAVTPCGTLSFFVRYWLTATRLTTRC